MAAAISTALDLDLPADTAIVVQNSNKVALRLLPCDVFARVAWAGSEVAAFEVDLAQRLAAADSPVAALDPRVEPRVYQRDGFALTLWTYYAPGTSPDASPTEYADALERLHVGMRKLELPTPHFTDRVAEAQQLVASSELTPALADEDRALLIGTLRDLRHTVGGSGSAEQVLHGEPHAGNLLSTQKGLVFIDLETCCRGPIEFDLAHAPEAVSECYPGADHALVSSCRQLVLAMVAAWRWDRDDEFPNGESAGRAILKLLRDGPPWPTLGDLSDDV